MISLSTFLIRQHINLFKVTTQTKTRGTHHFFQALNFILLYALFTCGAKNLKSYKKCFNNPSIQLINVHLHNPNSNNFSSHATPLYIHINQTAKLNNTIFS